MNTYLDRLITLEQMPNNVFPRQTTRFEINRLQSNSNFDESFFNEVEIEKEGETKISHTPKKNKTTDISEFESQQYNRKENDYQGKKNEFEETPTYRRPKLSKIEEIKEEPITESLPINENKRENNNDIISRAIFIEANPVNDATKQNANKETSNLHKIEVESQKTVTITIGKLEIKAIKQEKNIPNKIIRKPLMTLDQYIKNKSNK